jgi:hypothetical protein
MENAGGHRRWVWGILAALLVLHGILFSACLLTMDADLGRGTLRSVLDHCVDGYERVGFGIMPLGAVIVAGALVGLLFFTWRSARRGA